MITDEEWKDIKGYTRYEVSNKGRVRIKKTKVLKALRQTKTGYMITDLKENGEKQTRYVHRLVCKAFIANELNLPCVNHKDENKQNNDINNLEWCTVSYNNSYNGRAKRVGNTHKIQGTTGKKVRNIDTGQCYVSVREAGRKIGISSMGISYCLNGKQKSAGGYRWEVVA